MSDESKEARARELLAAEYERNGEYKFAEWARDGADILVRGDTAIRAIVAALGEAEQAVDECGQAYQVVGVLLGDTGQFDTPHGGKILDNLSQARVVHEDVLPWAAIKQWPAQYGCNGPEGTFWTDDAALANKLIAATFDRDEWTVTDVCAAAGAKGGG